LEGILAAPSIQTLDRHISLVSVPCGQFISGSPLYCLCCSSFAWVLSSCPLAREGKTLPLPILGFQLGHVAKRQMSKFINMYGALHVGETSVKSNSAWWLRMAYLASATKNNTFVEE